MNLHPPRRFGFGHEGSWNPIKCCALNAVVMKFAKDALIRNFIKCLGKIHHSMSHCPPSDDRSCELLDESGQLNLTGASLMKAMLHIRQYSVFFKMVHDGCCYDMLTEFAAYWCEADRSVVGSPWTVSLLEDRCYYCSFPLCRDSVGVDIEVEHATEH